MRKVLLGISCCANLGLLGFFKYFNFFAEELTDLLTAIGLEFLKPTLDIVLQVGISFYTFQTMSYTIDVYQGRLPASRNPLSFALFVVYFPQLVAGPIERATRLLPQLEAERKITWLQLRDGAWLILIGSVLSLVARERKLRRELDSVRNMIER